MQMKIAHTALLLLLICGISVGQSISKDLVNKNVQRQIDLTSQFARHTVNVTVGNNGNSAVSSLHIAIPAETAKHLSLLQVSQSQFPSQSLPLAQVSSSNPQYVLYQVTLSKNLGTGESVDITVKAIYTEAMAPYPAAISQGERQFVKYSDNAFFYSPYVTQTQATTIKLPSPRIESKTEVKPTSVKGDIISYGPYSDIQSFQISNIMLHFENNKPFMVAEFMTKEIEISHWGNVAVEIDIKNLEHTGAKLKGTFSRYDYQRNPTATPSVIAITRQTFPSQASDVYYRDEIGNISTSHLSQRDKGVSLELIPRYPLFGGWKASFYYGYNLPLYSYLSTDSNDGSLYVLNVTFGVNFEDLVVKTLTVRVILPEGASNPEVHVPFAIDSQSTSKHFTYLDTTGRTVLLITKSNVIPEHDQPFQVTYRFSQIGMLREPFILVFAFFCFFTLVMVYARLNFSIGPEKQRASNKAEELLFRVRDIVDQREDLHSALDGALTKSIKAKAISSYRDEKKKVDSGFGNLSKEMQKLMGEMDVVDISLSKKLKELERREERKLQSQNELHEVEIKYRLDKKIDKSDYEEAKKEAEKNYSKADDDIQSILADFTDLD